MRNNNINLIMEFKKDLMPYMAAARDYVSKHEDKRGDRYPLVYFAKNKNGKYGVTLPGVPELGINKSANDCPIGMNSVLYATAWAMLVLDLYAKSPTLYLEWCQKYNYLNRHNHDSYTRVEYVRVVQSTKEDASKLYALYVPQTGHGYDLKYKDTTTGEKYYDSLVEATFYRNREIYKLLKVGEDAYGELTPIRKNAYRRILTKGYFQAIILSSNEASNIGKFRKAFKYASNVAIDEKLRETFLYFEGLLSNEVKEIEDISRYFEYREILDFYLHTIAINNKVEKAITVLLNAKFEEKLNKNVKSSKNKKRKAS